MVGRTPSSENATLCGHRARRRRGMQLKLRFHGCTRNPVRTWCVSKARPWYAGIVVFSRLPVQPFADIVCVEGAECS